jgi:Ca2+-transporting ATPase
MPSNAWHSMRVESVLSTLGSTPAGISTEEARTRLEHFGPNRLPPPQGVSPFHILLAQLKSVVVLLLIAAAITSLLLADYLQAASIGAVLVINTAIGFFTEFGARRAMYALQQLDVQTASLMRDGELRAIDAAALVPGDVVELRAGHQVPADVRVIAATDLRISEAALTGESLPVSKAADAEIAVDSLLAERPTMAYKGTTVIAGAGRGVVTTTGRATELGRIGMLVGGIEIEPTPLERRLDILGRRLVHVTLGVATLVAVLGWLQGLPVDLVIETAIALAVAAVPEALPVVATISLAVGIRRMARRRTVVRRLPVVEALGSTTVICTDKTRTLTSGEMAITRVWARGEVSDVPPPPGSSDNAWGLRQVLEIATIASRPQASVLEGSHRGIDPVDAAILAGARRMGVDRSRLVDRGTPLAELPFSSERKLMATFLEVDGTVVAYVKGAPGRLLALSTRYISPEGERPLDDKARIELRAKNDELAQSGLRVIAVAFGAVPGVTEGDLRGLTFAGFIGLADPPAPGVKETIDRLRAAGLRTVMLTGDQRATAQSVGRALGLLTAEDHVIDGRELDAMDSSAVEAAAARSCAFSRVAPEHKLIIISALQRRGDVVAMLGDGINDAPALRKADVGVAMGLRGTDVAKEAASIVLQDDRFETIAAAVEEGRIIFDNIRKFVFYLFSCNTAEVLLLLVTSAAGLPLPLLPLQLLWLNIVTDTFPALALAMEPGDADVMRRPPRDPGETLLSARFLMSVLAYAALITMSTLAAFIWALRTSQERASTMAFQTLAFAQIGHLGNARSSKHVLHPNAIVRNRWALAGASIAVFLQLMAVFHAPLARILRVEPLDGRDWIVVATLAALPGVIGQGSKLMSAWARSGRRSDRQ